MDKKKKHDKKIDIRLTDEELRAINNAIIAMSKNDGRTQTKVSLSAGVRKIIMNAIQNEIQIKPKPPQINSELALGILAEIKSIGINVNQLAKNMNAVLKMGGTVSNSTQNKLVCSLDLISQHLEDIVNRVSKLS